jgi:hypothetical protein
LSFKKNIFKRELAESGLPRHQFHDLALAQWAYFDRLDWLSTGGRRPYPPVVRRLYELSNQWQAADRVRYRRVQPAVF